MLNDELGRVHHFAFIIHRLFQLSILEVKLAVAD